MNPLDKDIITWKEDPAHFRPMRRSFLKVGFLGGLGLSLGQLLQLESARADQKFFESKVGKAKSVIHVTLGGGMAAQESWDPKPEAPLEYRGPLGVVKTALPGVVLSENMPEMARVLDKVTVLRSMTGKEADHGRATYTMFTGYRQSPAVKHPSIGSVVSHEFGPNNGLPAYIAVPDSKSEGGTGFLSAKYGAFGVGSDPAGGKFKVRDLTLPTGLTAERMDRRKSMRVMVEDHLKQMETKSDALEAMNEFYQQAYTMISSQKAREAFDMSKESNATVQNYGVSEAGQRCLLARRLVEAGVRFVTVSYDGWDHHTAIAEANKKKMPMLDKALGALITDLDQRGLLDSTVVLVTSEFGRTPKINGTAGRDHFARVWSAMVAGGGFTRGNVFGATDATATEPERDPVKVEDLMTTIYHQMGINADKELMAPGPRPIEIVDGGQVIKEIIA